MKKITGPPMAGVGAAATAVAYTEVLQIAGRTTTVLHGLDFETESISKLAGGGAAAKVERPMGMGGFAQS